MKVIELFELLASLDPDAEVVIEGKGQGLLTTLDTVKRDTSSGRLRVKLVPVNEVKIVS